MEGGEAAFTVMPNVAVAEPAAFVPVIVYVTRDAAEDGVPVILPVDVLKLRPLLIVGLIEKLEIAPPVELTV